MQSTVLSLRMVEISVAFGVIARWKMKSLAFIEDDVGLRQCCNAVRNLVTRIASGSYSEAEFEAEFLQDLDVLRWRNSVKRVVKQLRTPMLQPEMQ